MKRALSVVLSAALLLAGCSPEPNASPVVSAEPSAEASAQTELSVPEGAALIELGADGVLVDGAEASSDASDAVYVGAEIVYYRDGTDETYGEGTEADMHSEAEAAEHTVVTITEPGTYFLRGTLPKGQIAVDLGEDAAEDPNAVVTLILSGVDVTCTVAPALIFYNVYECGSADAETATPDVDTSAAGANVVIGAGTTNTFTGSCVARIYKPGTDKKLHKYDGAFYSKQSLNISGDDSGVLNIVADNEGLDSELHLTINGGTVNITSANDGINTNEDGVSVTAINGGVLNINAGLGAEGDGIDSNGFIVINGGTVTTAANETSPDGGIDADGPIYLNGGTLAAFGTRNDAVSAESEAPYLELNLASALPAGSSLEVRNEDDEVVWSAVTAKRCSSVTLTSPGLEFDETYSLYADGVLQCQAVPGEAAASGVADSGRPVPPSGELGEPPALPSGEPGDAPEPPSGEAGEMQEPPSGEPGEMPEPPYGEPGDRPEPPDGGFGGVDGEPPAPPSGEPGGMAPPEGEGMPEPPSGDAGDTPEPPSAG